MSFSRRTITRLLIRLKMPKKRSSISSNNKSDDTSSSSSPGSGIIAGNNNDNNNSHQNFEKSGWLYKWTNYVRGYRQRWFVLDASGTLSYYRSFLILLTDFIKKCLRNPSEVRRACRGSISLTEANIHSNQGEGSNNLVSLENDNTQLVNSN